MGVPFQLILGTLLVLATCSSTHQTKLQRITDATSTPPVHLQPVTEIDSRDLNKLVKSNIKTDTLDSKSKSVNNVLYEEFPIKLGKSEPYSKPRNESSRKDQSKPEDNGEKHVPMSSPTENHREVSSRSIDIDGPKFLSSDFHNKNNVFTFSHQENHDEPIETAFKGTRHPSFDMNLDLTTPSTKLFDQKFKETVESVDQKLDEVDIDDPDDDDRIEEIDDDNLNVEDLLKKRPDNSTIEYESKKSIVNNETVDKNYIHKDLRIEHVKKINFEEFHNDTGIYDDTKGITDFDEHHDKTTESTHPIITQKNQILHKFNSTDDTFHDTGDHIDTEVKSSSQDEVTVVKPSAADTEDFNIPTITSAPLFESISHTTPTVHILTSTKSTTFAKTQRLNLSDQENIIPLQLGTEKYQHLTETTKPIHGTNTEAKKLIERFTEKLSTTTEKIVTSITVDPILLRNTSSGEHTTILENLTEEVVITTYIPEKTSTLSRDDNTENGAVSLKIPEITSTFSSVGSTEIGAVSPKIPEETSSLSRDDNMENDAISLKITEETMTLSRDDNMENGAISLKITEETTTQLAETSTNIQFETSSMMSDDTNTESTATARLDITTVIDGEVSNFTENMTQKSKEIVQTTTEQIITTTIQEVDISTYSTGINENGTVTPSETMQPVLNISKIDVYKTAEEANEHNISIEKTESSDQNDSSTTTELSFLRIEQTDKEDNISSTEISNSKSNISMKSADSDNRQREVAITTSSQPNDDFTTSGGELMDITTTIDQGIEITSMEDHDYIKGEAGRNQGKIAAIAISCVAAVCLVLLAGLLYVMKRRQKRLNYGPRCRPVSLDDYSIDNLSVYNSVRRKGAARMSKRSFGNPAFEDPVAPTHPLNFAALVKFSTNVEDMKAEFEEIPQITARTSELPEGCDTKNRYANVIPLPETRVFLKHIDGYPNSDYINASYVTGPQNVKGYYIATQGPMQNTVDDFWRMIWEQQSKVVLMLTHLVENGLEKCVDYLPESEVIDCSRLFGDFQITLKKREAKEKYIISSLQLKNMVSNSWREVTHFWYLGWPEKGVPTEANSLIAFLIEARSFMKTFTLDKNEERNGIRNGGLHNDHNPVVIHCSPGTGRTGVAIACDIAIREFETTRLVDIPKIVYRIRRDRANAIQTKEQYMFIYKVVSLYATKLTGGALDNL